MKKILLFLIILFTYLDNSYSFCENDVDNIYTADVWTEMWNCLFDEVDLVWDFTGMWIYDFENTWVWEQIKSWTNNIALYLWVFAVWSIVYWSLMLTFSTWEDDKIKKAKDIVKWWIIWFVLLISLWAIINLVVKIMYSI